MSVPDKDLLTQGNTASAPHSNWGAADSALVAAGSALVADVLRSGDRSGNGLRLRVLGESMLPTLWPGDVVEIEGSALKDVRPGDVVLALRDERLFLHRLLQTFTLDGFVLRGDSMPAADPVFPADALLGRLVRIVDRGKRVGSTPTVFDVTCSRAFGLFFCHFGFARRLALNLHSRRKKFPYMPRKSGPCADLTFAEWGKS
jgi:hypothetical protein